MRHAIDKYTVLRECIPRLIKLTGLWIEDAAEISNM